MTCGGPPGSEAGLELPFESPQALALRELAGEPAPGSAQLRRWINELVGIGQVWGPRLSAPYDRWGRQTDEPLWVMLYPEAPLWGLFGLLRRGGAPIAWPADAPAGHTPLPDDEARQLLECWTPWELNCARLSVLIAAVGPARLHLTVPDQLSRQEPALQWAAWWCSHASSDRPAQPRPEDLPERWIHTSLKAAQAWQSWTEKLKNEAGPP